jgi:hypothetical protein
MPVVPDRERVREKDEQQKLRQERNFNDRRGARTLSHLDPGNRVWVPDRGSEAEVVGQTNPRSNRVTTPEGTYRRNRRALCPLPIKQAGEDTELSSCGGQPQACCGGQTSKCGSSTNGACRRGASPY